MIIGICAMALVTIFFMLLKLRNKFINVITLYFYSVIAMMFINILYLSKLAFYNSLNSTDLKLYLWFADFRISLNQINTLYNISVLIFIFSTLYLIKLIGHIGWKVLLPAYTVICAFYLYTNSNNFIWKVYIALYQNKSNQLWQWISEFVYSINFCIILCTMLLPFVYLFIYWKNTKIYTKKRSAVSYALCIGLIDIYVAFMFYTGISPLTAHKNIETIGIPEISNENHLFMDFPIIAALIIILIMFLVLYFKPFDMYVLIQRRNIYLSNNNVNKNIRMILHTYKNAFIGIEKKLEMAQSYIDASSGELASKQMTDIRCLADDSIMRIERTLDSLKNPLMYYEDVNLSTCIRSASARASIPKHIKLDCSGINPQTMIFASEEHITEAFLNIIINAVDAINQKGMSEGHINITVYSEEDAVAINFYDDGCGIPRRNYRDIFKPFYSTKSASTCGGIGLNYVERIISNHRGEIYVKSKVGGYTVFQIVLPSYNKEEMYE